MSNIVIGMLAHVDAGKTTLSEAILYKTGTIRKLGRVDNRDTFFDTNSMERARGITIFSKQAQMNIGQQSYTLLDTPGHVDFSAEMERTLQVLDYGILVISGADGIQSHTETLWRLLARYRIPTFIFVNKMDQFKLGKDQLLDQLKSRLSDNIYDFNRIDIEDIAMCDETILSEYLENGSLDVSRFNELIKSRKIFPCFFGSALKITGIDELIDGISTYMNAPQYPEDFGANVYKIGRDNDGNRLTYLKVTGGTLKTKLNITGDEKINQIRIYSGEKYTAVSELEAGGICAVTGLTSTAAGSCLGCAKESLIPMLEPVLTYKLILSDDTDPLVLLPKLKQLEEEEPELHIVWNEILREIQIQVMGLVHIEILQTLINERFNTNVSFGAGNIVYKETITNTVEGVGHFEPLRHYAEVHLLLEPGEPGSGLRFETDCSEDILDKNWQRLIITHLYQRNHRGVLIGAPLTDVKITLVAGRAHQKHTEGGDFRQATYRALRQGLMQAQSQLLEPYYSFVLEIPQNNVGRAMTDLERMQANFALESGDYNNGYAVITGNVPVSTLGDYQTEVISYTKGNGRMTCRVSGYGKCHNPEEVIEAKGYDPARDTYNPADSVFCSGGSGYNVSWDEVFDHMHMESVLELRKKGLDISKGNLDRSLTTGNTGNRTVSDEPIGTDEIDEILRQTYYSNSRKDNDKRRFTGSHKKNMESVTRIYRGTEPKRNDENSYLLVDGYNIIYAWPELNELARTNLDGARGRLLDILCNYQAMKKCNLIVVFDAYRVAGHPTEFSDYHNIHVVFTKTAETADHYIERFAHEHGHKDYVRVATSDGLEQVIILGQGCHLVSAREFEKEVKAMEEHIRQNYLKE